MRAEQAQLDNGRVVTLIGVAPTNPAAFVIFRIGQWTPKLGMNARRQMATYRDTPYGAFNILVMLGAPDSIVGGFSEVSGLDTVVTHSDYRQGSSKPDTAWRVPGTHKVVDVTLKRGIVGAADMFQWLTNFTDGIPDVRQVKILLLDEARNAVAAYTLRNARLKLFTGPTLSAKGNVVAIEELTLVCEGVDIS